MKQEDSRIVRIESHQRLPARMAGRSLRHAGRGAHGDKGDEPTHLQYTQVATKNIENRLDKLEDDMNMWKKLAAGIAVSVVRNHRCGNVVD